MSYSSQQQQTNLDRVGTSWTELGRKWRPLRDLVLFRTELRPPKDGSIWLPPKHSSNHGGFANTVLMRALVMGVGPDCKILKAGDRIAYVRLFQGWLDKFEDGTLFGYIREDNVAAEDLISYPQT